MNESSFQRYGMIYSCLLIVVSGFCQNLLEKGVLRWEDFSLVVFDEAHHCEKAHPFNSLLAKYQHQLQKYDMDLPRILGLTASPAGKSDLMKTIQMLRKLIENMGGVRMCVVQQPECVKTLQALQSNARMEMKTLNREGESQKGDQFCTTFRHELNVYIVYCILKFLEISTIKYYMNIHKQIKPGMQDSILRMLADDFVEGELDVIQSSIMMLENTGDVGKVEFSYFQNHMQDVCMARSSLYDGGIICAWKDLKELNETEHGFRFAKSLGLPTGALRELMKKNRDTQFRTSFGSDEGSPMDVHACHLIQELTSFDCGQNDRRISLVLVKQRSTAYHLSKLLEVNILNTSNRYNIVYRSVCNNSRTH